MFNNIRDCVNFIETQRRGTKIRNLENFRALCEFFGNPQDSYNIIHVAGTNGKGSLVKYFSTILMQSSYNVATYTSPYIDCYNERIQVNGNYIPDEYIIKYTNLIISKYDELDKLEIPRPSFFALSTLIAFMFFKEMKVDFAVVEVGIGGLLDDTNVVKPILTAISNVSYDHMEILGNTIEEIALQKLGIVKNGIPLVTIENDKINNIVKMICEKNNSEYTIVKKTDISNISTSMNGTKFDYKDFKNIKLNMNGIYQTENASIAIEGAKYLQKMGFNIMDNDIYQGLNKTFWLARLERISDKPLIILDGAHNVDAFNRLVEYIKEIKKDKKVRLILAISANKDKSNMLDIIDENIADELIITHFNYKRSEESLNLFNLSKHSNKLLIDDLEEIINKVFADKSDIINIFAGSLYFASEVRKYLMK